MMFVGFYTVRVTLKELGVIDLGLYNVVGSVVLLCSFLTGSLTSASNRYFSKEIVIGNESSFNRCFCLNITIFGVLIIIGIVLLETIGLWYVNYKMIIPNDRLFAANIVYQFSIITLFFTFISIPYNALVISHEQMSYYAYIGILEAIMKLLLTMSLVMFTGDKLIIYALLMCLISIASCISYVIICRRKYKESRYRFYWNYSEFKSVISFIGWNFIGTISYVVKSQGVNLLINLFFSPTINAARALAFNVEGAVRRFSDGYFTASKPQIYKLYASREYLELNTIINRTTIICFYLLVIIGMPVILNSDFLLRLWLQDIPCGTKVFMQLAIIDSVLNIASEPVILTIVATAKQKRYQVTEFILRCSILPVSYVLLSYYKIPELTFYVCIGISLISIFVRAYFLKKVFCEFLIWNYVSTIFKLLIVTCCVMVSSYVIIRQISNDVIYLILSSITSIALLTLMYGYFVVEKKDRNLIKLFVKNKINNINRVC
jgi:O-antigen/teichoic acid export membrane protein